MWLVCKRGKCNQFSSINTFWNVNLRISQLKQTDSEGRVEIDFDSPVKVSMLECEPTGLECSVLPSPSPSPLPDIDLESQTLSPSYQTSDQILCFKSTKILSCSLWYLYSKDPFRCLSLSEEINKLNMYLFF